ncbi:MAG: glycosyltransferase [Acidimicrobiales bacterium]
MSDPDPGTGVAFLSKSWGVGTSEAAFVMRSLAGAASRHCRVDVLTVGRPGPARADGAFDVRPAGQGRQGGWPVSKKLAWPADPPVLTVIESGDAGAAGLARRSAPKGITASVADARGGYERVSAAFTVAPGRRDDVVASGLSADRVHDVGLHVPVNRIAAEHRHNGLGFTDYVLILTDRPGEGPGAAPTPAAAWVAARFPRLHVVVVEAAVASVWQFRSLRGLVAVDTRTDLWRLMAHARVVVDLKPGRYVARECVEALRFGTPVIAPAGTVGADLAELGGGLWYRDPAELLGCLEWLADAEIREALGTQGRRLADALYGDPDAFVERVGKALVALAER